MQWKLYQYRSLIYIKIISIISLSYGALYIFIALKNSSLFSSGENKKSTKKRKRKKKINSINSLSGKIRTSFRNSDRLREHPKGGVPAEQDYLRSAGCGFVRPYRFNVRFQLAVVWVIRKLVRASGRPPCNHPPVINGNTISRWLPASARDSQRDRREREREKRASEESRGTAKERKKNATRRGGNERMMMMKGKEIGKMKEESVSSRHGRNISITHEIRDPPHNNSLSHCFSSARWYPGWIIQGDAPCAVKGTSANNSGELITYHDSQLKLADADNKAATVCRESRGVV